MKYFTLQELTASQVARRRGINNTPAKFERENLVELVDKVLDPLREAWGAPIIVTSGYRCYALNQAVGGAKSSQHCLGLAADIRALSDLPADNRKLRDLIVKLDLPYDQIIDEFGGDWIHVSYRATNPRKQRLHAIRVGNRTVYKPEFSI